MPDFKIFVKSKVDGKNNSLIYNTETNSLFDTETNLFIVEPLDRSKVNNSIYGHNYNWDKLNNPATKVRDIRRLKISMGLSCNYSCSYCSQRFIPEADENALKYVPSFLEELSNWFKGGTDGLGSNVKIEFWGGEPLVYWKTLKPLAKGIRAKYPNAKFIMISNCTLLDDEKIEWLDRLGFNVGMSHDGASYAETRGINPLDVPEKRQMIMKLYNRFAPQKRISINVVLNKKNKSRAVVQDYLEKIFGREHLFINEGTLVDVYDEGSNELSIKDTEEKFDYRFNSFEEFINNKCDKFTLWGQYRSNFLKTFERYNEIERLKENSAIDSPHFLTVNLKGNVITFQNVNDISKTQSGIPHLSGNVKDFDNIKIKTISSWHNKPECKDCPVVNLCDVASSSAEGDYFKQSCDNAFNDHVVGLCSAIYSLTKYIPYFIEGNFREDRKNIFGLNN
jgi:uncharacterized protein